MSTAEQREIENLEHAEFIKRKRYYYFREKYPKLTKYIDSSEFQIWFESITGNKWKWPYNIEAESWIGAIGVYIEFLIGWDEERKEKLGLLHDKRMKAMTLATPKWRDQEKIKAIYRERDRLNQIHGKRAYHVDHIVPIQSDVVCGLHCEFNLQVISKSENAKKSNRYEP